MDWIGNVFIVIGLWYIGNKKRWAFLFSVAGETCWIVYSFATGLYSLSFICIIFAVIAARNYYQWGKKED